jgi:hypothetical protein
MLSHYDQLTCYLILAIQLGSALCNTVLKMAKLAIFCLFNLNQAVESFALNRASSLSNSHQLNCCLILAIQFGSVSCNAMLNINKLSIFFVVRVKSTL